jgi:hypothetical protein
MKRVWLLFALVVLLVAGAGGPSRLSRFAAAEEHLAPPQP